MSDLGSDLGSRTSLTAPPDRATHPQPARDPAGLAFAVDDSAPLDWPEPVAGHFTMADMGMRPK
jgi:hypothetical protein